jgi:hypothetical protein
MKPDIADKFKLLFKRNGSKRARYSVFWKTFERLRKEGTVSVFRFVQKWENKRFDSNDWQTTRPSEIAVMALISLAVMNGFLAVEKGEIVPTKALLDIFSGKRDEAQSSDLKEKLSIWFYPSGDLPAGLHLSWWPLCSTTMTRRYLCNLGKASSA